MHLAHAALAMETHMKTLTTAVLLALGMGTALTAAAYPYTDENGHKYECRDEQVITQKTTKDNTTLGTLGGGAIGGVLGSQIGEGSGKTAATVAGAVGGALIGRNQTKPKTKEVVKTEKRCRRVS